MLKKTPNKKAFTLIEVIIAMGIFVTALTAAAGVFLYTNRSQRKTQALLESQTDARFALEIMAQQVRRGSIDYDYYGGAIVSNPENTLALIDQDGNRVQFRTTVVSGRGVLQISQDAGATWSDITPPPVSVSSVQFYIAPASDPFNLPPAVSSQPRVTISLQTANLSIEGITVAPMFLQTTVSSRQYLR